MADVAGGTPARALEANAAKQQLVAAMGRFARGDDAALAEVCDLLLPKVYQFLYHLCRDQHAAEDLTQETFLRIHRARGLYSIGAPVLPWAYTIARRLFLDSVRARRVDGRMRGPERALSVEMAIHGNERLQRAPDELFDDAELRHEVEKALALLPEAQASALRLLKADELSVAEAAAVLGVSKGAVKLRAHRAYEALRRALGQNRAEALADLDTGERQR